MSKIDKLCFGWGMFAIGVGVMLLGYHVFVESYMWWQFNLISIFGGAYLVTRGFRQWRKVAK